LDSDINSAVINSNCNIRTSENGAMQHTFVCPPWIDSNNGVFPSLVWLVIFPGACFSSSVTKLTCPLFSAN
jgi:hypothetical protein